MMITQYAYPRVGLIGNPSDGYYGRTLAFTFDNFRAEVVLYESPELEILPNMKDHSVFNSIHALADDVRSFGYYGGIRLLKAAVKCFYDYTQEAGLELHGKNFTLRYASDIPPLVGLAGSSGIITACFRALCNFYGVSIPRPELANLILAVETEELHISAGLQDRVAQVYQGLVYMDFDRDHMETQGHGRYEEIGIENLPPLYLAFRHDLAQCSDVLHSNLRSRYEQKDPDVLAAMTFWSDLTVQARDLLTSGQADQLGALLNANFDRRAQICAISQANLDMVQAARSTGASAKFTGSGGAIVGTIENEAMFGQLQDKLSPMGITVIKPQLVPAAEGAF